MFSTVERKLIINYWDARSKQPREIEAHSGIVQDLSLFFFLFVRKMTLHVAGAENSRDAALVEYFAFSYHSRRREAYRPQSWRLAGAIFNGEDTPFPLSSRRNTYLTAMANSLGGKGG